MPELPELEVVAEKLNQQLSGSSIKKGEVYNHIPLHGILVEGFKNGVSDHSITAIRADGKFLIITMTGSQEIVINPMLTGRFRIYEHPRRATSYDIISLETDNQTLWYSDRKKMGRIYLVPEGDYSCVADFENRGPSALDPDLTLEVFRQRLRKHRGQIKNVLKNQKFVKGIGNAYADEILLFAGVSPFRKRSKLTNHEIEKLYNTMRKVLGRIRDILSERTLNEVAAEKRDFLMVHNRGGEICPLCGGRISEVSANRFNTSYCQTCQK